MAVETRPDISEWRALHARHHLVMFTAALLGAVGLALTLAALTLAAPPRPPESVYAAGFDHPRGLAFDSHGTLYIAEAGRGGDRRVVGENNETFQIGLSGRVSRVTQAGSRETITDRLPSIYSPRHGDNIGPAAVASIDDQIYVLLGTGWSSQPGYENTLLRIRDGAPERMADYSRLALDTPPLARRTDPRADVPGGVPFGMTALGGKLYTTDGNLEFVQEFETDGTALRRLLEYPLSNHVLTGITVGPDRALYVSEMGFWPYPPGSGQVTRLTLQGETSPAATGVTASIGAAFGGDGALYVLEHAAPLRQVHDTGRLLRVRADGQTEVVLDGLDLPTAVIGGPDGALYISDGGNRTRPNQGRVLRAEVAGQNLLVGLALRALGAGPIALIGAALAVLGFGLAIRMRARRSRALTAPHLARRTAG
jgi:hypothetical protein